MDKRLRLAQDLTAIFDRCKADGDLEMMVILSPIIGALNMERLGHEGCVIRLVDPAADMAELLLYELMQAWPEHCGQPLHG